MGKSKGPLEGQLEWWEAYLGLPVEGKTQLQGSFVILDNLTQSHLQNKAGCISH